jgi:hypothetical protein
MGTNFYWFGHCRECGHLERIHIGKASGGHSPVWLAHRNMEEHGRQHLVPELPTGGVVCAAEEDS